MTILITFDYYYSQSGARGSKGPPAIEQMGRMHLVGYGPSHEQQWMNLQMSQVSDSCKRLSAIRCQVTLKLRLIQMSTKTLQITCDTGGRHFEVVVGKRPVSEIFSSTISFDSICLQGKRVT